MSNKIISDNEWACNNMNENPEKTMTFEKFKGLERFSTALAEDTKEIFYLSSFPLLN